MMDDPRDAEEAANALPLNLEAEQALLGQLMFDNDVHRQVHDVVTAEDFSEPFHQRLYAAIVGLVTAGKLADPPQRLRGSRRHGRGPGHRRVHGWPGLPGEHAALQAPGE